MENASYELECLYTDVTSLCNRIELLPCSTARDRLAQSGKSLRTSPMYTTLLSLLSNSFQHICPLIGCS